MKFEKEVKIGAITLISLVLGYITLNFLKGVDIFARKNKYYVCFHNIGDVSTATPVKINGFKVGIVQEKALHFDEKTQLYTSVLKLSLDPEFRIMKGSKIAIKSNMLTGSELIINMPKGKTTTFFANNDTIPTLESSDGFLHVAEKDVLPAVLRILPKMAETLDNINKVISNKAIDTTLLNLKKSSKLMQVSLTKLNRALKDMPVIMDNLSQTSKSLAVVGQEAEKIKLQELVENLNQTSAELKAITQKINSSEGSLGLLISNKNLYHRVDSLAYSAERLLEDIKAHPKRYVKLSLF